MNLIEDVLDSRVEVPPASVEDSGRQRVSRPAQPSKVAENYFVFDRLATKQVRRRNASSPLRCGT